MVADLHHFDEEQDPDPGQNQSLIWIRIKVQTGIRIHINVLRIHNSENLCERKGKKLNMCGQSLHHQKSHREHTFGRLVDFLMLKFIIAIYAPMIYSAHAFDVGNIHSEGKWERVGFWK